jgi:hypothetical protein
MFFPASCRVSVPAYLAIFSASDSFSRNRSSAGSKSISFRKERFFRLYDMQGSTAVGKPGRA